MLFVEWIAEVISEESNDTWQKKPNQNKKKHTHTKALLNRLPHNVNRHFSEF